MSQQRTKIITNKRITYVVEDIIGRGTGGQVYKAYNDSDQRKQFIALKFQNSLQYQEEQTLKTLYENKQKLNHVVNVLDLDQYNDQIIIIMDLANGCFQDFWRSQQITNVQDILQYFLQIVLGTQELHSLSLIHRDLKLDNVVYMEINNGKHLKICDTGLMRQQSGRKTLTVGTPYYMAPEQINQDIYDEKVDIWALGMILYEMLAKRTMIVGTTIEDILNKILNISQVQINFQIDLLNIEQYSEDIKLLLRQMLNIKSSFRVKAEDIAMKLQQILKINISQQSNNDNNSFMFNSIYKDQIKQEIQREYEQKYQQDIKKLQHQHDQALKQYKDQILEYYEKQKNEEIINARKEREISLQIQFEQDLKRKEQDLLEEHNKQLAILTQKQLQELKNNQAIEMQKYKQQQEQLLKQNVEQQIKQKEQIIQQQIQEQLEKQLQNKEEFLKKQLQEQYQKQYQQEFEQRLREFAKFKDLLISIQQNIQKNKSLIENQLKQLTQQQQLNPSERYLAYQQTFYQQLQQKLAQLEQISKQLPQLNTNFNQNQQFNYIQDNLKKLTQITNTQQELLNTSIVENFITGFNLQLNEIKDEEQRLSSISEQQEMMNLQKDSDDLIYKITNLIQNQEENIDRLNIDCDNLNLKDNELRQKQRRINDEFYKNKAEFKQLQEIIDISKKKQCHVTEVQKQNIKLQHLQDKLNEFDKTFLQYMQKVSQQKENDLSMIQNYLNKYIEKIQNWEQKIYNYNQKQIEISQKEEQDKLLQELNKYLQTVILIKDKILLIQSQIKQNQNQNYQQILISIQQEYEISDLKMEQVDDNYITMQQKFQQQIILQEQVQEEQQKIVIELKKQSQQLQQSLNNLLNQYSEIQNTCKNEQNLENIIKDLERNSTYLIKDFRNRIDQFGNQIEGFEQTVFKNLEVIKLAELTINSQIDLISHYLKSETQKLNEIKQQVTEQISDYLKSNYKQFNKTLEELKSQLDNLKLSQTEYQLYQNIEQQKQELEQSIDEKINQLNQGISQQSLRFILDDSSKQIKESEQKQKIEQQIQIFIGKETNFRGYLQQQKERMDKFKSYVYNFDSQKIINFVSNYLDELNKISSKVESLESQSKDLNETNRKTQIYLFNQLTEEYQEQIKKLQKKKQENCIQFNNLEFYAKNIEVLNCLELLFKLWCYHKREINYLQKQNDSQKQGQKKKQEELQSHQHSFNQIDEYLCNNFLKNFQYEDQILIYHIRSQLKLQGSSFEQHKGILKQFQENRINLEEQVTMLKSKVDQQNKVKIRAKIKQTNDNLKLFVKDLQQAFEQHIPQLKNNIMKSEVICFFKLQKHYKFNQITLEIRVIFSRSKKSIVMDLINPFF